VPPLSSTPFEDRLMSAPETDLEQLAKTLERSEDYRVLRRLKPRQVFPESETLQTKQAILLDVETTGLDPARDEVVELGMVKFSYHAGGEVGAVIDTFSSLHEPTIAIPEDAIKKHGLTDAMVAGHKIDGEAVNAFVSDAAIVIAHNAGFDRKFAERFWPVFASKHWGCSVYEVAWRDHGFEGSRLGYLLNGIGLFHRSHRGLDDCHALLEILAQTLPGTERTVLAMLLESARRKTVRIWAEQSPFDLRGELKKRGYRWSSGEDGRPRAWFIDVDEENRDEEIAYLRSSIYLREVDLLTQTITALDRLSVRG
jgi:DNA polymerase III subunit epsilon